MGGINGNNTITAIATMVDEWAYSLENNLDLAIIILDQTAAYDLISHQILLQKMSTLGFQPHTIEYFRSYLKDRSQTTMVDGAYSEELFTGPLSVIQGSVLSCLLFLIYTLDLPLLFLQTRVTIEDYHKNTLPKPTTFVDDIVTTCKLEDDLNSQQQQLDGYMDHFEQYMSSNKLLLNRDKTQLVVITQNPDIRTKLFLTAAPKNVTPIRGFTYLGIEISDDLRWNYFLEDSQKNLISALKKRLKALRLLKKYASFSLMKKYANGIFLSKLLYRAELWGGGPLYLKKKIKTLILEAARICLGKKVSDKVSQITLLKEMNWLSLEQILTISSCRLTHSIIHKKTLQS